MKKEVRCKQCGKTFVKYAYQKVVRCEACRKENAVALHLRSDEQEEAAHADAGSPVELGVCHCTLEAV